LIGTAIVDQHAAAFGALGVLAALMRRERTGLGCTVDSNLLSAGLDFQIEPVNYHLDGAKLYDRSESWILSRFHQAPYGVFKTSDGWLTLSLADGATGQKCKQSSLVSTPSPARHESACQLPPQRVRASLRPRLRSSPDRVTHGWRAAFDQECNEGPHCEKQRQTKGHE
jgi:crotonobetainyl-CoA:carnitine CoA-transferase CaiB-like acyl-CoA transferase